MPTSSQGIDLISGATKITIKATASRTAGNNKLDASTLELAHGSNRVYEDGLTDLGTDGSGVVVTISANGYGSPPGVGSTVTAMGKECKCTESTEEASVGELMGWSASYTSDYVDN